MIGYIMVGILYVAVGIMSYETIGDPVEWMKMWGGVFLVLAWIVIASYLIANSL